MLRQTALILSITLLAGCEVANGAANSFAQIRAKRVVNSVVAQQYPGINAAPVTDCIIEAASADEIVSIAGASATGVTQATVKQVLEIARRRQSVNCIAENGIALLGG
ncbi:hypothetical protein MNBD_ALPHA07-2213 [hydrothermal vent metagenome]|uniref:Succinate dehydrogenase n=1 Tax=hydrothermal vent metagenome TaxID=652676 RepID=A0A3B0RRL4_9ZZZZ